MKWQASFIDKTVVHDSLDRRDCHVINLHSIICIDYWYLGVAITDGKETSIYSSVNIIQSAKLILIQSANLILIQSAKLILPNKGRGLSKATSKSFPDN